MYLSGARVSSPKSVRIKKRCEEKDFRSVPLNLPIPRKTFTTMLHHTQRTVTFQCRRAYSRKVPWWNSSLLEISSLVHS